MFGPQRKLVYGWVEGHQSRNNRLAFSTFSFFLYILSNCAVFLLSITSGLVPRSAETLPKLTEYITAMLIMSVMCVVVSIVIVYLDSLQLEGKGRFNEVAEKSNTGAVQEPSTGHDSQQNRSEYEQTVSTDRVFNYNHGQSSYVYKRVYKHVDKIALSVFLLFWMIFTVGFFIVVTT